MGKIILETPVKIVLEEGQKVIVIDGVVFSIEFFKWFANPKPVLCRIEQKYGAVIVSEKPEIETLLKEIADIKLTGDKLKIDKSVIIKAQTALDFLSKK